MFFYAVFYNCLLMYNCFMKLISNTIKHNQTIDTKHSMDGGNVSPHLSWSDFPKGTKSFAILVHDKDAPTQSGFWHWQIVNIPVDTTELKEAATGTLTNMLEKNNDTDGFGWYGPQPPQGHGIHHYKFTVLALDVESIETTIEQSRAYTSFMLWSHTIDQAEIIGTFEVK